MSKEFIEHIPCYVSGVENKTYKVTNFAEVLEIPFVKKFSEKKTFYSYAISVDASLDKYKLTLMSVYDWNDEYNGCTGWWVIGYLPGFVMYETELEKYQDLIAGHKPNCWTRKYSSNKSMLGTGRPIESKMKILKELGWKRNDEFGVAVHCDCGYENKKS